MVEGKRGLDKNVAYSAFVGQPIGQETSSVAASVPHPKDRYTSVIAGPVLSKARASAMLAELESGFRARTFQEKFKSIGHGNSTVETLAARWKFILQASGEVFERYGFQQDHPGEHEFNSILKPVLAAYPELLLKVQSIFNILQVSDDIQSRRIGVACQAVEEQCLSKDSKEMGLVLLQPNDGNIAASASWEVLEKSDGSRTSMTKSEQKPELFRQLSSASSTAYTESTSNTAGSEDESEFTLVSDEGFSADRAIEHQPPKQKSFCFSHAKALKLQGDLLTAFTAAAFQKQLNELARAHRASQVSRTASFTGAFRSLVRSEQYRVIPRYGFEPSEKGVSDMLQAFHRYQHDPDIFVNAEAIREALYTCITDHRRKNEQTDFEGLLCNSRASVVALLQEQVIAFSIPAIQHGIAKLKKQASLRAGLAEDEELPDGGYHLQGRAELAFQVQRHILPRYGFEASRQGVQLMIQQCSCFLKDQEVSKLFDVINSKLGMTATACKRFRELVARITPEAWLPLKDVFAAVSESRRQSCRIGSFANSLGKCSSSPSTNFGHGLSSRSESLNRLDQETGLDQLPVQWTESARSSWLP